MCESYFAITRMDGGGVHTPHERERWPAIASGSRREWPHQRREWPHHITPAIPAGRDPSSIRRYEWRRQKARRDITTQSPSCVGPMMNVTFEPCRRLRTDEDWCRAPAVYCDNMERSVEVGITPASSPARRGGLRFHARIRRCRSGRWHVAPSELPRYRPATRGDP